MTVTVDSSLEAQRDAVILAALPHVPFDGWGQGTLRRAAEAVGLGAEAQPRLFPGGAVAAVTHFMEMADRMMLADLAAVDLAPLKVRQRVATAIRLRLERWQPHREAVRRALALVPLPRLAGRALGAWYRTVDAIWRGIGDRPVDFSFYTKRALLAGVYAATLFYWLEDRSEGCADTWAFLDRRIADVMRLPKLRGEVSEALRALPNPVRLARRLADRVARAR
jgi:ubiquinone biosynthesis protein COQ9